MDKRDFKDHIFTEISRITRALSNSNRMEIIHFIANGEKSVEDIALQTGIRIANASQHLQNLKKERLVISRKIGVQVFYSLASEEVYMVWKGLRDLALHTSPFLRETVTDMKHQLNLQEPVSLEDLKDREDVFWIDVRPEDEFNKKHRPNAFSIPLETLEERLQELPKDKLIVAYCRGMFCTLANEAVQILLKHGFRAKCIEENVVEFQNH